MNPDQQQSNQPEAPNQPAPQVSGPPPNPQYQPNLQPTIPGPEGKKNNSAKIALLIVFGFFGFLFVIGVVIGFVSRTSEIVQEVADENRALREEQAATGQEASVISLELDDVSISIPILSGVSDNANDCEVSNEQSARVCLAFDEPRTENVNGSRFPKVTFVLSVEEAPNDDLSVLVDGINQHDTEVDDAVLSLYDEAFFSLNNSPANLVGLRTALSEDGTFRGFLQETNSPGGYPPSYDSQYYLSTQFEVEGATYQLTVLPNFIDPEREEYEQAIFDRYTDLPTPGTNEADVFLDELESYEPVLGYEQQQLALLMNTLRGISIQSDQL